MMSYEKKRIIRHTWKALLNPNSLEDQGQLIVVLGSHGKGFMLNTNTRRHCMKCVKKENGIVIRTSDEKAERMVREGKGVYHPKKNDKPDQDGNAVRAWERYE